MSGCKADAFLRMHLVSRLIAELMSYSNDPRFCTTGFISILYLHIKTRPRKARFYFNLIFLNNLHLNRRNTSSLCFLFVFFTFWIDEFEMQITFGGCSGVHRNVQHLPPIVVIWSRQIFCELRFYHNLIIKVAHKIFLLASESVYTPSFVKSNRLKSRTEIKLMSIRMPETNNTRRIV